MTRRALLYVHDIAGDQVDAIGHGFFDLWTDIRLEQSELLGFELAADNPKADRIVADVELVYRARRYFIAEVEQRRRGRQTTVAAECQALWYRLNDRNLVGSRVLTDQSPVDGLDAILEETDWHTDASATDNTGTFSLEQQDRTVLELLRTWAKITGLHLRFDTLAQTVALTTTTGSDLAMSFRYRRNLTGVRRRLRPPEATVLYAYGADDLNIAGVNGGLQYVEDFTFYTDQGLTLEQARELYTREKVYSDRSFIRDVDLLPAAEARIALLAAEQVTYEFDVLDLSEITGIAEHAEPGDTVRVYDPAFDLDVRATVTRFRRHPLQPWRNRLELATSLSPLSDGSAGSRPSSAADWRQFTGPVRAGYTIRNDAVFSVARIPLRFREGGQAFYHLDLRATGVGAGDMIVTVYDTEADAAVWRPWTVPFTDGEELQVVMTWAAFDLLGSKSYRVRVTTEGASGPDPAVGVDITEDAEGEATFSILALGAVQETPTAENTATYVYAGSVTQEFTVPDNVEEITVEVNGSAGDNNPLGIGGFPGNGGRVTATFIVTPGQVFDVYVGGILGGFGAGTKGNVSGDDDGGTGGGYSAIVPTGEALINAWLVGGAGGGAGRNTDGGDGGHPAGTAGVGGAGAGGGGTQSAGGAAGSDAHPGTAGSSFQGGDGGTGGANDEGGGGGGGGWFGGGGGATSSGTGYGGGGGSSYAIPGAIDTEFANGANSDTGTVIFTWQTPA